VNRSGLIGGAMLGCALIHFGGWHLYVVLLAFFVIGSGVTKLGIGTKARSGIAQEEGGCRGFSHAFANVGMAVILAFLAATTSFDASVLWLAAVAALATATADTTASEVGQLLGRRPFMPLTLRRVPVGTEGAISVEGTLAGAAAAIVVAILGAALWRARSVAGLLPGDGAGLGGTLLVACIVALAAILGSWLESVAGSWNRTVERPLSNGTLNFLNTAVGALIALALLQLL
jgi:uncharacterized protein (TIGR00297 family)